MMVVGGSEGGIRGAEWLAFQFAERGFATLAVAYFGMEGLPEKFADIPLEYFDRAISWLGRQSFVEPGGIALLGSSRGAELVLLVASHDLAVDRVVAYAPSHVVWGAAAGGDAPTASSWTRGGRSLPFVPSAREADLSVSPYRGTPDFLAALQQTGSVEAASIPVEQIRGAVLLLSGEDDLLWPSTFMANASVARLKKHRHRFVFEHHAFAKAGHVIAPGFDPAVTEYKHPSGILLALGGTPEANREAQDQALKRVLAFLREDHGPSTRE
jgi:dienelactone hydrolase